MRRAYGLAMAAAVFVQTGLAWAQTSTDPAPYLHTPPVVHHKPKPKPVPARPKQRHVPVVTPHHAGPPRRSAHGSAAKALTAKPEVAAAVKPVPKKPVPPPLPADIGTNTGMHLPRYAAIKTDKVNMRSGPGERYPVLWTYGRRDLPVKIEREFDIWRLVEDMDGIKGWMQQGTLTGRRSFVITGTEDRTMRADASDTADAVAVLKPGVVGRLRACEAAKDWCQVQVQDYRGWLKRSDFWGTDPGEAITP